MLQILKPSAKPSPIEALQSLQEQGVPLEAMFWKEAIPGLDQLEGLYLEFIEVHVPVLQSMPRLSKLRCALGQQSLPFLILCQLVRFCDSQE